MCANHYKAARTLDTNIIVTINLKLMRYISLLYNITEATWDDWSSWSKCSRSCGSGSQTRQRQCLNQINDTDGFVSDCDGVGTNLRSCNTEPCPC